MTWDAVGNFLLCFAIILAWEAFRRYVGLPITFMDLIGSLFSCVLLYCIRFYKSIFTVKETNETRKNLSNPFKVLSYLVFIFGLSMLGIYLFIKGVQGPLTYYEGYRGAGHGYSSLLLGLTVTIYCIGFSVAIIYRFILLKRNVNKNT
ncbi:hypothetical protein FLM48_12120 [Shewanella sp. Scap07]|uniref:hypothetical protein n=1 Tax=Shewanella sp. Scap07 TaxID=2589987 RepID=UPI0015BA495B|nr:hypothetical protein [Shewanella sp. Scap07]QLE85747.1 hypothetical protein FLM48_12120 [Shewanella sp. Scap07]